MAKYIRVVFYLIGLTVAGAVIAQTSMYKFAELEGENVASPAFASVKDKQRQLACLTQNVYYEAGSEPPEGKIAVAQVVMNRTESGIFPRDPCAVVYQKSLVMEKVVCQFSWYCERPGTRKVIHNERWRESQDAARMVLFEGFRLSSVKDALYFHADHVNPNWGKRRVAKIGNHIFYNGEKANGRT